MNKKAAIKTLILTVLIHINTVVSPALASANPDTTLTLCERLVFGPTGAATRQAADA